VFGPSREICLGVDDEAQGNEVATLKGEGCPEWSEMHCAPRKEGSDHEEEIGA
jgi:hypothetical protein